ncbi:MAG: hypothetical protein HYW45_03900 [Candidatus Daviesbacteria bacterium]|nr:MAG: hypothetical protein HYW45_03900 [Candidatus Daviesbacteria bacterium]
MLTTPHSLVGATIAVLVPNPALSIPLAIGSHFILDSIPHWQEILYPYKITYKTWIRLPIDITLAVFLVNIISTHSQITANTVWLTAFAANIPDFDSIGMIWKPSLKNKLFKGYYDWHCAIQRETSSFWGVATQVIISLGSLSISLR